MLRQSQSGAWDGGADDGGELDEEDAAALERRGAELQNAGHTAEALDCFEQALHTRRTHALGERSPRVRRAQHTVADVCNSLAMQRLSEDAFDEARALLRRAESLSERDSSLRAITYNNMACLHRREGHLRTALQYLMKALEIESALPDAHNPSDTHLNICAIQSQLGRHELALEHAQAALVMLHDELFDDQHATLDGTQPFPPASERMSVLAIAYHNMAAEQEFLGQWESALLSYKRGMQLARLHVGQGHPVTDALTQAHKTARRTIERKLEAQEQKRATRMMHATKSRVSAGGPGPPRLHAGSGSAGGSRPGSQPGNARPQFNRTNSGGALPAAEARLHGVYGTPRSRPSRPASAAAANRRR